MHSRLTLNIFSVLAGVCFVIVFAYVGIRLLTSSHAATPPPTGISVSGNQFYLNGKPFTPHGFNAIAMLNSQWCTSPQTATAAKNLGTTELNNAKNTWNANTLRFQVSQPVLASDNGPAYAQQIAKNVAMVRQAGFVVDISMQDQHYACGPAEALPGQETESAWKTLITNTSLKNDPDIMFELFNETQNKPVTTASTNPQVWNWPDWLNGGRQIAPAKSTATWSPYTPIGMQDLVDYLRNTLGVNNLLLADGAEYAGSFENVPLLSDPGGKNQIAYAVHPYSYADPSNWNTRWGDLSATHAVLATEWNCFYNTTPQEPAETAEFLNYMRTTVHDGILGHALDTGGLVNGTGLAPNACGKEFQQDYTDYFAPSSSPTPTVKVTAPASGATVSGNNVTVSASASVSSGSIKSITLKTGGTVLATCSAATCSHAWDTTSLSNGSVTLEADTTASDGKTASATETVTVSNSHPVSITAPTNVASPSQTTSSIDLDWKPGTDSKYQAGKLTYQVFRDGNKTGSPTTAGTTSFVDSSLSPGTYYSYTLVTRDPAGNQSSPSAAFTQETKVPDCAKPAAPQSLSGKAVSPTSVALTWKAVPDPSAGCTVTGYVVSRDSTPLGQPRTPGYTDDSATAATAYTYSIVAVETGNIAGRSSSVKVTTPASTKPDPGPSAPSGVSASAVSSSQVNLTWDASSDKVTGIKDYEVLRDGKQVGTSTTTSFGDSGLSASTIYHYQVTAVSGGGKTASSSTVNVTTPSDTQGCGCGSGSGSGGGTGVSSSGGGNEGDGASAYVPPILQDTTSVGSGSETGNGYSYNPTDPGDSTTNELAPSEGQTAAKSKGLSTRQVAFVGTGGTLVVILLAGGVWWWFRRRNVYQPILSDPDIQSHVVVGSGRDDGPGPQPPYSQ